MLRTQKFISTAAVAMLATLFSVQPVHSATYVDVYTSLGNFKIELYEDEFPGNVARFLYFVLQGRWDRTIFHYADDSLIAGGKYQYNRCAQGPVEAWPYTISVPTKETGLANRAGTIALLRDQYNPDFLSNDWIINLDDNSASDPATRPVVIGEIVTGFDTLLAIRDLQKVTMRRVGGGVPALSYEGDGTVDCDSFDRDNVVFMDINNSWLDDYYTANYLDPDTGELRIRVDAGAQGIWSLAFVTAETETGVVIQARKDTLIEEPGAINGYASFDQESGLLVIPELTLNGEVRYTNLVLLLTNFDLLQFTLLSYEGAP